MTDTVVTELFLTYFHCSVTIRAKSAFNVKRYSTKSMLLLEASCLSGCLRISTRGLENTRAVSLRVVSAESTDAAPGAVTAAVPSRLAPELRYAGGCWKPLALEMHPAPPAA